MRSSAPGLVLPTLTAAGFPTSLSAANVARAAATKGALGIYQVMPITEAIQDMILKSATAIDIGREAQKNGVRDLRQSGLVKVKQGITSLEEVLGCTNV